VFCEFIFTQHIRRFASFPTLKYVERPPYTLFANCVLVLSCKLNTAADRIRNAHSYRPRTVHTFVPSIKELGHFRPVLFCNFLRNHPCFLNPVGLYLKNLFGKPAFCRHAVSFFNTKVCLLLVQHLRFTLVKFSIFYFL